MVDRNTNFTFVIEVCSGMGSNQMSSRIDDRKYQDYYTQVS